MATIGIFDKHRAGGVLGRRFPPQGSSSFWWNDGVLKSDNVEEAPVESGDFSETVVVVLDKPIDHPSSQAQEVVHNFEGVVLMKKM